jgi:hypothetical protein
MVAWKLSVKRDERDDVSEYKGCFLWGDISAVAMFATERCETVRTQKTKGT